MAFLVTTFQPTTAEFLYDQENALIATNRIEKGPEDALDMEGMSPIGKSELEVGGISDEVKRTTSMH